MSNATAIAAVTATLHNLLTNGLLADQDLPDATVTMQPLDRARVNGNTANQLNIFLYHVLPSGAWRNMGIAGPTRSGVGAAPVLGLNLYYLITAFGRDNDTLRPFSHHLMGRAMSTLHDHPLLGADEIKAAYPNNDLWAQIERVRFTLQPFSMEEIAKLWTGFQTQYRLSVAYEAAVVLIESTRATAVPLPVLTRGPADSGVTAQSNLIPPFPTIDQVTPPSNQPAAGLGDLIVFTGHDLAGAQVALQFTTTRLAAPITLPVDAGATDTRMTLTVPNDPANWPAGMYTVEAVVSGSGVPDRTSNEMPLAIAPRITSTLPMTVSRTQGNAQLNLTCSPEVRPEQRVALLLGSREILAESLSAQTGDLTFIVTGAVPGDFWIRLRVDGVDSQLVNYATTPPTFDATQKVTIQ
jgi:Pvc16 N-terminal domain